MIGQYLWLMDVCVSGKDLRLGRGLHARFLKLSLNAHTLLCNRLIDMYAKCGAVGCAASSFDELPFKNLQSWNILLAALAVQPSLLHSARQLFDQMPERNLVSYNTLISKLSHEGWYREALRLFWKMQREEGLGMDRFTVVGIAPAFAASSNLRVLHSAVISRGLQMNCITSNVLIDGYGKCRDAGSARRLFDRAEERDVVSWTSLIAAYASAGMPDDALLAFTCAPARNAVSWTALISGLEQNGREAAAVEVFRRMMLEKDDGVQPTTHTLASFLSACARLGLIHRGRQAHCYLLRRWAGSDNVWLQNALTDMYAKCGDMTSASSVFDGMPVRDVVSWNSMITGYAQNGLADESLRVFGRMLAAGMSPSGVSFLGVLSACSHGGLVAEGRRILGAMGDEFGVRPGAEHYAAFVDALGRSRRLGEAVELMDSLGSCSVGMWGALLGACRLYGDVELGKRAAQSLIQLEPGNGVRYVALSNIYAASGRWVEAGNIRLAMKTKGLTKDPGCSWTEIKGAKNAFLPGDKSHSQTQQIYDMLRLLTDQMKQQNLFWNPSLQ